MNFSHLFARSKHRISAFARNASQIIIQSLPPARQCQITTNPHETQIVPSSNLTPLMNSIKSSSLAIISIFCGLSTLSAEVKLPAIFGDHMVLQESIKLPVWGTADPGETVTVTVGKESAQATADATGKWKAELAPLPKNVSPVSMTVAGKTNTVSFNDILVGDVWVCSGQSNMEFNLGGGAYGFGGAHNADAVLPKANDPQLRLFLVAHKTSLDPQTDVDGKWELCTTESAGKFSAIGYFFGRELRQALNKPIGLIGTYWGGTPAQAWTSISGLQKDPALKNYVNIYEKSKAGFAKATAEYPEKMAAFKTELEAWDKTPEGVAYRAAQKNWEATRQKALSDGKLLSPRPHVPKSMPVLPAPPDGGQKAPVTLYDGMVAPIIPYAMKGVIWYQGESNASRSTEYRALFADMITDWRTQWGEGNFPFLFVQLANFKSSDIQNWPYLREAQLLTLALPNTGMATAIDIGTANNIHPADKEDVGRRLALTARHVAYGEDLVYSGPIYKEMKNEDHSISLAFTNEGSGLVIGKAPWVPDGFTPLPVDKLIGFTIAGDDQKWMPAEAKIVGDKVIVSSPQVSKPVAVRYAWTNDAKGNLYNKEGLPASSFRTDDWSDPVALGLVEPTR